MVATIAPVGYGGRRNWLPAALLFTIGTAGGAFVLGAGLGLLGRGLTTWAFGSAARQSYWSAAILAAAALLYAIHELRIVSMPYPQRRRQVALHWRYLLPRYLTPLVYGWGLGIAYGTFIIVGTTYIIGLGVFLAADWLQGGLIFMGFGLGRAVLVWLLGPQIVAHEQIPQLVDALMPRTRLVHLVNGIVLSIVTGWLVGGLLASGLA